MREFLRRGGQDQQGLDDLARRVAERRRDMLQRNGLDGTMQEVRELLDHAVLEERKQLARDVTMDDDDRAFARAAPRQPARLHLRRGPGAGRLRLAEQRGPRGLREDQGPARPRAARPAVRRHEAGAGARHRRGPRRRQRDAARTSTSCSRRTAAARTPTSSSPTSWTSTATSSRSSPQDIDELLDALAQRAAAAPADAQLDDARSSATSSTRSRTQAFGSPALMESLSRLDGNLQSLRPGEDWSGSERFDGEQGLGLGDGTGVLQDLADLDDLAEQLAQSYDGARMDDVDLDKLARQLGDEAAVDARTLAELERALRDSGYLKRSSDGQLRLSPRAMRQLGKALLQDVANRMSGRQGQRDLRAAGAAGERSGATREWAFGDTEPWDVTRTITNAMVRTAAEGGSPADGVRLEIGDVEVVETEARTQAAVALLVDTSFSMAMDGRWVPMKRTALALHQLITTPLPRRRAAGDRVRPARRGDGHRAAHRAGRALGQGHQPAPRAAAGQPALPQAPQRAAGAADRHRRRADLPPRAGRRGLLLLPAAPADDRLQRARARRRRRASAPRRRSSGSARTPASRASSSRWPGGSTAAWSRPSSTTWAPPSSAATWAPAAPGGSYRDQFGVTGVAASGSADAAGRSVVDEAGQALLEDRPERHLRLELAQQPHAAEPGAVDEEVRRRQVELDGQRVAGVAACR